MVRYLILLIITGSWVQSLKAQELSQSLVFEERVYNFGTIHEKDGKVSHTFYFRNTGKKPVTITAINTGCSCIGKKKHDGEVKPGERTALTITFDPAYKSGFFSKEIFIFSENGKQYNHVWVEGNIIPGERPVENDYPYNFGSELHLRYKVMALGYLKPGQAKKVELPLINAGNKEMVLKLIPKNNSEGLYFTNPGKIAPNSKRTVTFNYSMPFHTHTDVTIILDVYVNDKKLPEPLQIKVLRDNKL
ncbi:DUF1573 domain-containing protein [Niastella populi]|uniref:DUF1573 domain-containing protein n=1 Tax=Niastella populi TaxID=550983 RepID=A0A1V9FDP9_9BACT|nr:DUF1573 domain-containing protein [Niastella populi]OQP56401.1 hypothetical protein A4R26_04350 [Niastella populi]